MTCAPLSRTQPKKNYALFNSSQLAATATGSFLFFGYRYRLIVLDYWVVKPFVFGYFFLGKQSEENGKELYYEISVGCRRIQAVRRPEWQPTGIRLLD